VDVLRAAVAEVEDYTRIKVAANTQAAITGPAVADVIHMIAELAENAVVFSPPNTPVLISGDVVGRGFAVEIEDRGLGLSEERRAELNDLLENPPPFDLSGSDQLGLFVASQLARKHNIRISLRGSPYGGTTAIVLIPTTLVVSEENYQQDATDAGLGTGVPLTGRHAARDDTDRFTTVAQDTAGTAGPPAASEAAASEAAAVTPGDTAERWPADSGADPWTAHAAADSWPVTDAATGWAGNGVSAATEGTNGRNGFQEFPGYGEAGGWPGAGDQVHADPAERHELDHDAAEFAETDSLPRRVRQASLAPQLRENTLYGRAATNGEDTASSGTVEERSPEEARSTITAIQQGWERGRSLFDPPEKTTGTMTGSQPAAEPTPPEAGEAGPQGDK
jgi:anti-sigma regulatory factor (Ser/Thr protein kinase)